MLVSGSYNKDLLSVKYYWNGSLSSNEKLAMNVSINEINSDSSERKYIHLSNSLIQSYEIHYLF